MAERIPEEILTDIRARISIVEVISPHVALRKAGRSYTGLCPFHNESTPSFSVNEEGGFFHCFGCGAGGNVFTFLTRVEGLSFPEAVRRLAVKAGVVLPQSAKDPQSQERARLLRLNEIAATYFQRCLWGNIGEIARRYLEERGLNRSIAEQFRLGFAPPGREGLARFLAAQRADLERAADMGLVGKARDGRYFDKFRHRLVFPITDLVGRIVGFGGRLLPMPMRQATDGKSYNLPKYLNSPDSILYKKGTLLYGLSQAKPAIQQQRRAIVVEGYIDLLALVQHGQPATVAVLGTALGVEQLKILRRATGIDDVYLFFDGDEAGRRAATRAFPLCIEAEMRGRGVFLPQGDDPDTFARENGDEQLRRLLDQAEPLEDFYFARHVPPPGASTFQRVQAAREAMMILQTVSDGVVRGALLTQIAQRFAVNEEELRRTVATPDASRLPPQQLAKEERLSGQSAVEAELIQLMLLDRNAALSVAEEKILPFFQRWGSLANDIIEAWRQEQHLDLSLFLAKLPKQLADLVSRAYGRPFGEEEEAARQRLLFDCIVRIRDAQRKSGKERLLQELREAEKRGDDAAVRLGLQRLQHQKEE